MSYITITEPQTPHCKAYYPELDSSSRVIIGHDTKTKKGFTLVELSIALVIIGLIVGGILFGQNLINAATIRSQITQIEKYNTIVHTFQTKYNGLPGDLRAATAQSLGFYYVTDPTYVTYVGMGDNNGLINDNGCGNPTVCNSTYLTGEPLIFWRHLSDANLIDGNYGANLVTYGNPPVGTVNNIEDVGRYLPPASIGGGASIEANTPGDSKSYFLLMRVNSFWGNGGHSNTSNPLTAYEAYAIDAKVDDGLPGTKNVIATNSDSTTVANLDSFASWTTVSSFSGCVSSGAYAVTQTTKSCSLRFKFQ